jgi:hypothetical protein
MNQMHDSIIRTFCNSFYVTMPFVFSSQIDKSRVIDLSFMTQAGDLSITAFFSCVVDCFDSIMGKIPTCANGYPDDRE